jgi:hypothetical protein
MTDIDKLLAPNAIIPVDVKTLALLADEVVRLRAKLKLEGAERYWEGRWRDEKNENEKIREALKEIADKTDVDADECPAIAKRALESIK